MSRYFLAPLLVFLITGAAAAADVEFRLVTQKNVIEPAQIEAIRSELLLGSEDIDRILIVDALNDGFDENDMLQIYPSGRILRLRPITEKLDSLLRSYSVPPNVQIFESRQYYTLFDSLSRYHHGGRALGYGLLAGIEERLMRGYPGGSVEGYFKVTPSGISMQAWNFDAYRVSFPAPTPNPIDTVLMYVRDTVYVPEVIEVVSDPVVIRDTVYLPSELLRRGGATYYRVGLATIGGGYHTDRREASRAYLTLGAGNEWDFGVWDPWISGRQDMNSRVGLRFVANMAPWKSDTLSPRFLATSFETMYIPAWDRSFFAFAGIRAFYHDDLFWDGVRAAWDEDAYQEPHEQDLSQFEFTVKAGLDKFSAYGGGKKFGAWLKLSGWTSGGNQSGYTLMPPSELTNYTNWHWEHEGGFDIEGAGTVRISESAQAVVSVGQRTIPNMSFSGAAENASAVEGLLRIGQIYQRAGIRFVLLRQSDMMLRLGGSFRNNILAEKFKHGTGEGELESLFYPYMENAELGSDLELDVSIVRFHAGVRYIVPSEGDSRLHGYGGLLFLFE